MSTVIRQIDYIHTGSRWVSEELHGKWIGSQWEETYKHEDVPRYLQAPTGFMVQVNCTDVPEGTPTTGNFGNPVFSDITDARAWQERRVTVHPMLGDLDIAIWTVRDSNEEIVAEFKDEDEALAYGSHLANANPDECYSVVVGRWKPIPEWQTPKEIS